MRYFVILAIVGCGGAATEDDDVGMTPEAFFDAYQTSCETEAVACCDLSPHYLANPDECLPDVSQFGGELCEGWDYWMPIAEDCELDQEQARACLDGVYGECDYALSTPIPTPPDACLDAWVCT